MCRYKKRKVTLVCAAVFLMAFLLPTATLAGLPADSYHDEGIDLFNAEKPLWKDFNGEIMGIDLQLKMGATGAGCGESEIPDDLPPPDDNPADDPADDPSKAGNNSGNGSGSDLPEKCPGACNSVTPVYPTVDDEGGQGNVTMYTTEASDGGACNYGTTDVMYFAAMSVNVVPGDAMGQWQGGSICGQCAEVTTVTSKGPKKVVVRIMDKCPDGDCGIDLGGAAPAEVMPDGFGRYDGQWRFVSCDGHPEVSDGPPTLDVINGSNNWWSRVHVRNGTGAVDSIHWQATDGSVSGVFPFAANPENAYEVPTDDVLQSNVSAFLITVYYRDGSTATVTLSPQQLSLPGASYPLD